MSSSKRNGCQKASPVNAQRKTSVLDNTSIPGISHAKDREKVSQTRKKIWILLFVIGLVLTLYQVQTVVADFLRFPVSTNILVEETHSQFLPAITICTYNRIKCKFLQKELTRCHQENCPLLSQYCQLGLASGCSLILALAAEKQGGSHNFNETCPKEAPQFAKNQNMFSTDNKSDESLGEIFGSFETPERTNLGMKPEMMVKSCIVSKENCSTFFSIETTNTVFRGNCFGFNQKGNIPVRPGPAEGITLEIYLSRDEFIWHRLNTKEGLRVVLHEPHEVPLIEEQGVDVSPGQATSFSVQTRHIIRQPTPYPSACIRTWNETFFDEGMFPIVKGRRYTQVGCSRFCLLELLVAECHCIFDMYDDMNVRDLHRKANIPPFHYCSMANATERKCIRDHYDKYDNQLCRCHPRCNETVYEIQTSSLTWPSNIGWFFKAKEFDIRSKINNYQLVDSNQLDNETFLAPIRRDIQENLLRLDFYFASSRKSNIHEEPVYPDFFSLLTNLGGALSLWMGLSFIMVVEVVEILIDSCARFVRLH